MKTKRLIVTFSSLLMVTSFLSSCNNEEKEVGVSKVEITGIPTAYGLEDEIDWDALKVVVTYEDNSVKNYSNIEFDVTNPSDANTEAIVDTDGLYSLTQKEAKRYEISVALSNDFTKYYEAGSIVIGDIVPDKYELISFTRPNFIEKYERAIASYVDDSGKEDSEKTPEELAAKEAALEAYYKKTDELYTVGTMNEFKFIPLATFDVIDGDETSEIVVSNLYKKTVVVKEIKDNNEVDADQNDYQVTSEGFKFNDSAINKVFKVSVKPEEFQTNFVMQEVEPVTFTFKVEKGLNIYNAKQLGILNMTSIKASDNGNDADPFWECRYGINRDGSAQANDLDSVFFNEVTKAYEVRDTLEMWKEFLSDTVTYTENELANYVDVPAVFFQDDINITTEDIPNEYFIKDGETGNYQNKGTGALRDCTFLYYMPLNGDRTINGNYFNLDTSSIPLSKSTSDGGFHIYTESDGQIFAGHSVVFYFAGLNYRNGENEKAWRLHQSYDERIGKALIKNMNSKGNTTTDISGAENDFEKKCKITGLIFAKCGYAPSEFDNLILKEYMIGIFANQNFGQKTTEHEQKDVCLVNDSRIYDCSNSGLFNYKCGGLKVSSTDLKRFGGAPIINAGDSDRDDRQATTKFTSDCVLENYVTGGEVYFAAMGASEAVSTLKAMNPLFALIGSPFAIDEKMNVLSLSMDGDGYIASDKRAFFADTIFNCDSDKPLSSNLTDATSNQVVLYNTIPSIPQFGGNWLPTCKTELDPYPFFVLPQGQPGLYTIDGSMQMMPITSLSGHYLSMFAPAGATTLNIMLGIN